MLPVKSPKTDKFASRNESRQFVRRVSRAKIYKDYEKAFSGASGLPLGIRPIDSYQVTMLGKPKENRFCSLMAATPKTCTACLCHHADMEAESRSEPYTLRCFAGMYDTLVPIQVDDELTAFLQTGQVLLQEPTERDFFKVARRLLAWGADVDLKSTHDAFLHTRVLKPEQYKSFISMLKYFADYLASVSGDIVAKKGSTTDGAISKVRTFIDKNYKRRLTIDEAAKTINISARYFCKKFRNATGMTFVEYLNRFRIEKAKDLLGDPNKKVSEAAFEVGFESLTQFTRSFKKYVGQTPTAFKSERRVDR